MPEEWRIRKTYPVAPFAGAWIEIIIGIIHRSRLKVAPFAGAWIEMDSAVNPVEGGTVAPFAGAWIEIITKESDEQRSDRRSLRGSVD